MPHRKVPAGLIGLFLLCCIAAYFRSPRLSDITALSVSNGDYQSLKRQAVNNTIVVVPINEGMLNFAHNLICSVGKTSFDPKKLVFWTLGEQAGKILEAGGYTTFHDPSLFGVATNENPVHYTDEFHKMMLERPKFFHKVLSTGLDMLFMDVDTVLYDNPLAVVDDNADLIFSSDSYEFYGSAAGASSEGSGDSDPFQDIRAKGDKIPPVCMGFFYMRSGANTIRLCESFRDVLTGAPGFDYHREKAGFVDDQSGMDVLLNDGRAQLVDPLPRGIADAMLEGRYSGRTELKVRLLDQSWYASGHLFRHRNDEYQRGLEELQANGKSRLGIHFNWDTGEITKVDGAKQMGIWQLTEEGQCMQH